VQFFNNPGAILKNYHLLLPSISFLTHHGKRRGGVARPAKGRGREATSGPRSSRARGRARRREREGGAGEREERGRGWAVTCGEKRIKTWRTTEFTGAEKKIID
jgi:hypothetical protein